MYGLQRKIYFFNGYDQSIWESLDYISLQQEKKNKFYYT